MHVAGEVCTVSTIYRKISVIYRKISRKKGDISVTCGHPVIFYPTSRNDL